MMIKIKNGLGFSRYNKSGKFIFLPKNALGVFKNDIGLSIYIGN